MALTFSYRTLNLQSLIYLFIIIYISQTILCILYCVPEKNERERILNIFRISLVYIHIFANDFHNQISEMSLNSQYIFYIRVDLNIFWFHHLNLQIHLE